MAVRGCLVLRTSAGWSLAAAGTSPKRLEITEPLDPASLADRIATFVQQQKLSRRRLLLAVDSPSVLTCQFSLPADKRRNRRVLSYELERFLPWAAEEFLADFVIDGDRCFGAAIETQACLPLVSEMERRGLCLQSISPAALLALQSIGGQIDLHRFDLVIWRAEEACELIRMIDGRPSKWHHVQSNGQEFTRELAIEILESGSRLRVVAINATPEIESTLRRFDEIDLECVTTESMADHVLRCAESVFVGKESPRVEFRREALAGDDPLRAVRGSLSWLVAAAAVFLIAVTLTSWYRVYRDRGQIRQFEERQATLFRQAIPSSRVPVAIVSRMESEHAKLLGAHVASDRVALPTPALNVLHRFLRGVQAAQEGGQECTLREVRILNGRIDVDASFPSFSNADSLVSALRDEEFEMDLPVTTQNSDRTVKARIFGKVDLE